MARRAGRLVSTVSAFWDTSALVPLCIHQDITPRAIRLYKTHEVVIWWSAPVEIASALSRLKRMKQISVGDYAKAVKLAHALSNAWSVIQPSDALRSKAVELVNRYELRAADAFHLAAALEWCEDAPQGRVFLSADERLRQAALLTGFDARQI